LLKPRLGAFEGVVLGFESGLADKFLAEQTGVTLALCTCRGEIAFGGRQLGAGGAGGQFEIGRVEFRASGWPALTSMPASTRREAILPATRKARSNSFRARISPV
jgi:hypothetical protein